MKKEDYSETLKIELDKLYRGVRWNATTVRNLPLVEMEIFMSEASKTSKQWHKELKEIINKGPKS